MAIGVAENDAVAMSDIQSLYTLKATSEEDLTSMRLQIKEYDWFPVIRLKPTEVTAS